MSVGDEAATAGEAGGAPASPGGRRRVGLWRRLARWLNPLQVCFGAVFQREMRVDGRRRAVYWQRFLILMLMLGITGMSYVSVSAALEYQGRPGVVEAAAHLQGLQGLAPAMVASGLWVIYVCTFFIASASGAPAIAQERRGRTIDALVCTTLSGAEVVFGHIAARTVQVALVVLLAMPVLLASRVFGGIEAGVVAAACAVILSTVVLAVSLSVAMSAISPRATGAAGLAIALMTLLAFLAPIWSGIASARGWFAPPGWAWWFAHPVALLELTMRMFGDDDFSTFLGIRSDFWIGVVGMNLGLALVLGAVASVMFRRSATNEKLIARAARVAERRQARRTRRAGGPRRRGGSGGAPKAVGRESPGDPEFRDGRRVGDHPVLWRELRQAGRASLLIKVVAIGGFALVAYALHRNQLLATGESFAMLNFLALFGLVLAIGGSAGGTIAGEREARTWGVLLTTRVSRTEILVSKTLGVVRRQALLLGLVVAYWILAGVVGAAPWLTILHMAMVFVPTAFFLAATGTVISLVVRRAASAATCNILLAVGLWAILPWVLLMTIGGVFGRWDDTWRTVFFWTSWYTSPFVGLGMSLQGLDPGVMRGTYTLEDNIRVSPGVYTLVLGSAGLLWTFATAGVIAIGVRLFHRFGYRES